MSASFSSLIVPSCPSFDFLSVQTALSNSFQRRVNDADFSIFSREALSRNVLIAGVHQAREKAEKRDVVRSGCAVIRRFEMIAGLNDFREGLNGPWICSTRFGRV